MAEPVQMAAVLTAAMRLTTAAHLTTAVNVRTSGTGNVCRVAQVHFNQCNIASNTSLQCLLVQGTADCTHVAEYTQRRTVCTAAFKPCLLALPGNPICDACMVKGNICIAASCIRALQAREAARRVYASYKDLCNDTYIPSQKLS